MLLANVVCCCLLVDNMDICLAAYITSTRFHHSWFFESSIIGFEKWCTTWVGDGGVSGIGEDGQAGFQLQRPRWRYTENEISKRRFR